LIDNHGLILINSNEQLKKEDISKFILNRNTEEVKEILIDKNIDFKVTEDLDLSDSNYLFRPKQEI
jgi:hypothetical protein